MPPNVDKRQPTNLKFGALVFNQFVPELTQQAFRDNPPLKELVAEFNQAKQDVLVLGHSEKGTSQSIFVAPIKKYHELLIQKFEYDPAVISRKYEFKNGNFEDINYIGHTGSEVDISVPAQIKRCVKHLTTFKSAINDALENLKGYITVSAFNK